MIRRLWGRLLAAPVDPATDGDRRAAMPFVYSHLGKPELELLSTLGGGLVYGWLTWRTGSIVWGALGHVVILTTVTVAAS